MAMTPGEIERKVRQLDNDVQATYEMLATLSAQVARQGNLLKSIDGRLDGIDARLDGHDARFDAIDARLDGHDARFDAHDARFDTIDTKLDELIRLVQR